MKGFNLSVCVCPYKNYDKAKRTVFINVNVKAFTARVVGCCTLSIFIRLLKDSPTRTGLLQILLRFADRAYQYIYLSN